MCVGESHFDFFSAAESFDKRNTSIFGTKSKKALAAEAEARAKEEEQQPSQQPPVSGDVTGRSRSGTARRNSVFSSLFNPDQPPKTRKDKRQASSENVAEGERGSGEQTQMSTSLSPSEATPADDVPSTSQSSPGSHHKHEKGGAGVALHSSVPSLKSPRVTALRGEESAPMPSPHKEKSNSSSKKKKESGHKRMSSVGSAGRAKGRRLSIFGSVMGKKECDAPIELDLDEVIG